MNLKILLLCAVLFCSACSHQRYAHREKVKVRKPAFSESITPIKPSSPSLKNATARIAFTPSAAPAHSEIPLTYAKPADSSSGHGAILPNLEKEPLVYVIDSTRSISVEEPPENRSFNELDFVEMLEVILVLLLCFIIALCIAIVPAFIMLFLGSALAIYLTLASITLGLTILFGHWSIRKFLKIKLKFSSTLMLSILLVLLFLFVIPILAVA